MDRDSENAEMIDNNGLTTGASGAVAPVQVVQNSGAKVVQNDDQKIAPKIAPVAPVQGSILDVRVSCFSNYYTPDHAREVSLLAWLTSSKYAEQIGTIRQTANKTVRDRLKAELPAITPSGVFSRRNIQGLIRHSGFIQFDIDGVTNIHAAKRKITALANVAYCGLSASGRGLWGLIPITEPEHHVEYFQFIEKAFASMGIAIDPACKDVCRLRGYGYDPDGYFNHSAKPLVKWYKPVKRALQPDYGHSAGGHTYTKVEALISQICASRLDLTAGYGEWFRIGCAIANEFGERGRNYFHAVSQFHPGYTPESTDKQFSQCLKHRYSVTIATFLGACRDAGILYSEVQKKIAPVQNGVLKGIDNQSLSGAKNGGGIGIAPLAPVGDFTHQEAKPPVDTNEKWRILNRLLNKGYNACKEYGEGRITLQEWDEVQDGIIAELKEHGIPLEDYVKAANWQK